MSQVIMVRDWDADAFHAHVLEFEGKGYLARRETYRIIADMNPETGYIVHLHSIEMYLPDPGEA